jgi:release factor glutamine methyltransferase
MPSVSDNLKDVAEILSVAEIPDPRREAGSLLALVLGKDQTFLFAHPEYELTNEEQIRFDEYVQRRSAHEPFQYIAGRQEFYGIDFIVTPDVLIPRPETELLVTTALDILKAIETPLFCEVGTGSGCISVALLHETKNARAIGLEISPPALKITELNATNTKVADRLELRESDIFSALNEQENFDLIVSNPPYIPVADIAALQVEVKGHEPLNALTDKGDGLSIIKRLIAAAPEHLKPGCCLLIEIGFGQADAVQEMISFDIWESMEFLNDFQQIPRVVKLKLGRF